MLAEHFRASDNRYEKVTKAPLIVAQYLAKIFCRVYYYILTVITLAL